MHLTLACLNKVIYSRTSRKRPPEMSSAGGCLREVVVYTRGQSPGGVHMTGDFFVFGEALPVAPFLRHLLKQFSVFARER